MTTRVKSSDHHLSLLLLLLYLDFIHLYQFLSFLSFIFLSHFYCNFFFIFFFLSSSLLLLLFSLISIYTVFLSFFFLFLIYSHAYFISHHIRYYFLPLIPLTIFLSSQSLIFFSHPSSLLLCLPFISGIFFSSLLFLSQHIHNFFSLTFLYLASTPLLFLSLIHFYYNFLSRYFFPSHFSFSLVSFTIFFYLSHCITCFSHSQP